jgi:hypothetical protein
MKSGIVHNPNIYPETVPILKRPSFGNTKIFNSADKNQSGKI